VPWREVDLAERAPPRSASPGWSATWSAASPTSPTAPAPKIDVERAMTRRKSRAFLGRHFAAGAEAGCGMTAVAERLVVRGAAATQRGWRSKFVSSLRPMVEDVSCSRRMRPPN